jgi:hypothetical protein
MLRFARTMTGPVVVVLGISIAPMCALADAIDGEWCLGTSHFAIDGPNILTPGGSRIQGNYSRHGFVYVVPSNEPGAGVEINMVLLNEESVRLTRGGQSNEPEIGRRCKPTS